MTNYMSLPARNVWNIAGCLLLAAPGAAFAQASGLPSAGDGATRATPGSRLDEIVVTARKREEAVQDIPVSVTALSGQALDNRNVRSIENIASLAPNLNINNSSSSISGSVISIRSISDNNPTSLTNDPPVGLYLDGVYLGRAAGGIFDIVDLERVEVLRGPQGTLFGRNTTGGAVSLVTSLPGTEPGIQQKVTYGSFNEWSTRTRVDFGEWGDTGITMRLTYAHRQRDGYVNNILQPKRKDPGALNTDTAFGVLHGEWDRFRWDVRADFQHRKGVTPAAQMMGASPLLQQYYSQSPSFGGRPFQLSTKRQKDLALDFRGFATGKIWGGSNTFEFDINEDLTVKSITAYRGLNVHEYGDLSGNTGLRGLVLNPATGAVSVQDVTPFQSQNFARQRQFSEELQLLGTSERVDYVVGLYYYRERVRQLNPQQFTFIINPTGTPLGIQQQRTVSYKGTATSYAAFGQASYTPPILDDRLEVTLGGRYSEDKRMLNQADSSFGAPVPPIRKVRRKDSNFSYAGSLLYKVQDDVNLYAQYATGYKSGGFNAADLVGTGFAPEKVSNFELGLKSEFFDRRLRLNLAGFYADYKDRQITVLDTSSTAGASNSTQNAGRAKFKGIELELVAVPTTGLTLEATVGYTDPKYTRYDFVLVRPPAAPVLIDVSKEARFHYQTKLTTHFAVQYAFPETSFGIPAVRVEWNRTGKRWFQPLDRLAPLNDTIVDPKYNDVQAQLSLTSIPAGSLLLDFAVYGRNLLNDKKHLTSGIDFGQLGFSEGQFVMPRSYGVSLTADF